MPEQKIKDMSLLKRWKQVISRFITFCLYGDQSPIDRASAKQLRADVYHKADPKTNMYEVTRGTSFMSL
jgi:hypothetical protein